MSKKIDVAFLGNSDISISAIKAILKANDTFNLKLVITNEDKAKGRSQSKLEPTVVANFTKENNIRTIKTNSINKNIEEISKNNVDFIITCSFGQMLSDDVLKWPKRKSINIHTSILPKGRGGAPIHWAIINNEFETGYSIMEMISEMDAGNIYSIERTNILLNETYDSLYLKLSNSIEQTFISNFIDSVIKNPLPVSQDSNNISFSLNIRKKDRYIDWNKSANNIIRKINGLNSIPQAIGIYEKVEIKITSAIIPNEISSSNSTLELPNGAILDISIEGLLIKVGFDQHILLKEFTIPGKKKTSWENFYNGNKDFFSKEKQFQNYPQD